MSQAAVKELASATRTASRSRCSGIPVPTKSPSKSSTNSTTAAFRSRSPVTWHWTRSTTPMPTRSCTRTTPTVPRVRPWASDRYDDAPLRNDTQPRQLDPRRCPTAAPCSICVAVARRHAARDGMAAPARRRAAGARDRRVRLSVAALGRGRSRPFYSVCGRTTSPTQSRSPTTCAQCSRPHARRERRRNPDPCATGSPKP